MCVCVCVCVCVCMRVCLRACVRAHCHHAASSHNTTDLYITEEGPTPPLPNQISLGVWITIGMLSFIALSMLLYLINGLSLPRLSVEHSK